MSGDVPSPHPSPPPAPTPNGGRSMTSILDIALAQMSEAIKANLTQPNIFMDLMSKQYRERLAAMTPLELTEHQLTQIINRVRNDIMTELHNTLFPEGRYCDHEY